MSSLALEAAVVGFFLAVVLAIVVAFFPLKTSLQAGIIGFVIGAGTHLFFEFTGLNTKYCKIGHACA